MARLNPLKFFLAETPTLHAKPNYAHKFDVSMHHPEGIQFEKLMHSRQGTQPEKSTQYNQG
jgi:hypothetical protein